MLVERRGRSLLKISLSTRLVLLCHDAYLLPPQQGHRWNKLEYPCYPVFNYVRLFWELLGEGVFVVVSLI